jgi:hypothetical protein
MLTNKQSLFIWRSLSVQGPSSPSSIDVMEKNGYIKKTLPTLRTVKIWKVWCKSNFPKLYLSTHMTDNVSIYKEIQLKSQLQHSGT